MKYTEKYLELNEQRNTQNPLVRLLGMILGGGSRTIGAALGAAGFSDAFKMAQDVGRNIRKNEYLRSGAKAGFGQGGRLGQDLISRAVDQNVSVTDFQRAIGRVNPFTRR